MPTARTTIEISILGRATYNVSIGASLASVRTDALAHVRGGRLIVTDSNVAAHHLEAAMHDCNASGSVVIPAGEQHKTPQTLVDVVRKAADAGLDRGGAIVALGGGVVGDIAGLAAAVFMRGIDFINLPTSLLAMVDAAIGGKTGVDLPEGKNLLGAFHQPRAVVCDMALLASLPEAEWRNGMAEVIKTAIVGDAALFAELVSASSTLEALRTDYARSAEVVRRCVEVKGGIVMRDERESGERMQLNAGHTIGHAIEAASHYRLPHGQAVAIGLALEARVAQQLGLADASFVADLDRLLAHYGLPTTPPDDLVNMAQPFLRFDKKRHAGKTRYALPCAPGSVRVVDDVDAAVVEAVLLGKAG